MEHAIGVTVTVLLQVLMQPAALVVVTVYVPEVLTLIQLVVAPVFHRYFIQPAVAQSWVV